MTVAYGAGKLAVMEMEKGWRLAEVFYNSS